MLVRQRGWSPQEYEEWLGNLLISELLTQPKTPKANLRRKNLKRSAFESDGRWHDLLESLELSGRDRNLSARGFRKIPV